MTFFPSLPEDATVFHVWNAQPEIYAPLARVTQAIMRNDSPLTPGERELIASYVSGLNACQYCSGGHAAAAEAFGIDEGFLGRLLDDVGASGVDEKLVPVLGYVKKLTLTPARMTQADADAVYAAGWDEKALHDAIAVCCMFNFMNRLVDGHGVEANPEVFKERGQRHRDLGYLDQYPDLQEWERNRQTAD
jgi:uncharacterized peroxidase-related enzyme